MYQRNNTDIFEESELINNLLDQISEEIEIPIQERKLSFKEDLQGICINNKMINHFKRGNR